MCGWVGGGDFRVYKSYTWGNQATGTLHLTVAPQPPVSLCARHVHAFVIHYPYEDTELAGYLCYCLLLLEPRVHPPPIAFG